MSLEPEPPVDGDLPTPATVEGLMVRLEAHRAHPATLPLHDALFALHRGLREGRPAEDLAAARAAVADAGRQGHPLREEILMALGLDPAPGKGDLAALLATIPGLPCREDPVDALALHLRTQVERIAALERAKHDLTQALERQARLLSLAVGAAAILLILMALGWAMAPAWLTSPAPTGTARSADEHPGATPRSAR